MATRQGRKPQAQGIRRGLWHLKPDAEPGRAGWWKAVCPVCHAQVALNRAALDAIDSGEKTRCNQCVLREQREREELDRWRNATGL